MSTLRGTLIYKGRYKHFESDNVNVVHTLNKFCQSALNADKNIREQDKSFAIGIDASTTCTGFCITRMDKELNVVFDFERRLTPKETYIKDLEYIISNICFGLEVNLIALEQPIFAINNNSTAVLNDLYKKLRNVIKGVPELYNARVEYIQPNTWKSKMLIAEKGKGRYNSKECIAEDISDRYPQFEPHLGFIKSKDFDSFDAIGILYHYLEHIRNADGDDINIGAIEPRHISFVYVEYQPKDKPLDFENAPVLLKHKLKNEIVKWNDKYNFYDNIKMASSRDRLVQMEITDVANTINVCWEVNLNLEPTHTIRVTILKAKHATKSVLNELDVNDLRYFYVY